MLPRCSRAADAARSADAAQTMIRGRSMLIYRGFSGAKAIAGTNAVIFSTNARRLAAIRGFLADVQIGL